MMNEKINVRVITAEFFWKSAVLDTAYEMLNEVLADPNVSYDAYLEHPLCKRLEQLTDEYKARTDVLYDVLEAHGCF